MYIKIYDKNSGFHDAIIRLTPGEVCIFSITLNSETHEFSGPHFFSCLKKARCVFEKKEMLILCVGSLKNACVSGMSMGMSGGRMAYIVELGRHSSRECLRDIFEPIDLHEYSTVEEQESFIEQWYSMPKI